MAETEWLCTWNLCRQGDWNRESNEEDTGRNLGLILTRDSFPKISSRQWRTLESSTFLVTEVRLRKRPFELEDSKVLEDNSTDNKPYLTQPETEGVN